MISSLSVSVRVRGRLTVRFRARVWVGVWVRALKIARIVILRPSKK